MRRSIVDLLMPETVTSQGFRYELAPTRAQARTMRFFCAVYRRAYNRYVAGRTQWWNAHKHLAQSERGKSFNGASMSKELTELMRLNDLKPEGERDRELSDMRRVPRMLISRAIRVADDAFEKWFQRGRRGEWTRPPRFKSRLNVDDARFGMQVQPLRWTERAVRVQGLGFIRTKESTSKLKGRPVRVTISERAGRWFISITCLDVPREVPERTDTERVGVDLGVRKLATLSTGAVINPSAHDLRCQKRAEKRIRRLQRSLARKYEEAKRLGTWDKHNTSKGYRRVQLKLRQAHMKAANQRLDRSHKLTTRLVKEFRAVVVEDLSVQTMTASAAGTTEKPGKNVRQKAGLSRAILERCFGTIRRQLEYKAKWYGATLETVPRFYPSSKTCSGCGAIKHDLGGAEVYKCTACGLEMDRDLNAASNIRNYSPEAREKLSPSSEGKRVDCHAHGGVQAQKHVQGSESEPDAGGKRRHDLAPLAVSGVPRSLLKRKRGLLGDGERFTTANKPRKQLDALAVDALDSDAVDDS